MPLSNDKSWFSNAAKTKSLLWSHIGFHIESEICQWFSSLVHAHSPDIPTKMATTATNITGVDVSLVENTIPTVDPNLVTESQVVNEEQGKQEHLYIDFASDAPPVTTQNSQTAASSNQLPKRIDPRQEWINTDKTKPYFCKLCDYNMDCMEVGALFDSKCQWIMAQTLCKLLLLFQHIYM